MRIRRPPGVFVPCVSRRPSRVESGERVDVGGSSNIADKLHLSVFLGDMTLPSSHLLASQGMYNFAEPLYERAHGIRERSLGPDHPDLAISLKKLAASKTSQVMVYKI